jgi:hypothetical protein
MKYEKGSFITVPTSSILGIGIGPQALYMWLCSFANNDGECFPSRATLANRMGCSERAVDGYMQELIDIALVVKEQRFSNNKQVTNTYHLPIGVAKSARGVAESAPTPSQNLRTELNPVLTQSTKLYSADAEETTVEPDESVTSTKTLQRKELVRVKGYDPASVDRLMNKSALEFGIKFFNPLKQKKHISTLLAGGKSESECWELFIKCSEDDFWGKSMDWGSVLEFASRVQNVPKKRSIIKIGKS